MRARTSSYTPLARPGAPPRRTRKTAGNPWTRSSLTGRGAPSTRPPRRPRWLHTLRSTRLLPPRFLALRLGDRRSPKAYGRRRTPAPQPSPLIGSGTAGSHQVGTRSPGSPVELPQRADAPRRTRDALQHLLRDVAAQRPPAIALRAAALLRRRLARLEHALDRSQATEQQPLPPPWVDASTAAGTSSSVSVHYGGSTR